MVFPFLFHYRLFPVGFRNLCHIDTAAARQLYQNQKPPRIINIMAAITFEGLLLWAGIWASMLFRY